MDPDSGEVDRFRESVLADVSRLRRLEVSMLEAEVMKSLMEGRKTAVELIDRIYGLRRGDEGFNAARLRMRRAIRSLEKRGLVATRLFGRERPYRITRHGIAVLASIVPDTGTPRVLYPSEMLILYITGILGAAAYLYPQMGHDPVWGVAFPLSSAFFTLFGISITVCWRVARRVI